MGTPRFVIELIEFTNCGDHWFPENQQIRLPAGMVMQTWLGARRREFSRMAREMVERVSHFEEQFIRYCSGEPMADPQNQKTRRQFELAAAVLS